MGETDAQLIARTARDPAAFAAIFDRHYPVIYRYAVARIGVEEGEEIAAQTFLVAFEQCSRFDISRSDARPWLFGIATNLIHHHRRSRQRSSRAMLRLRTARDGGTQTEVEARVDLRADARPVMAAVATLPPADRETLLLYAWADLSYDEIAQAMRVPVGTVRSRLHRARRTLQAQLAASTGGAA